MHFKSLKTRLIFTVSALVIVSGVIISLMVSQRYSASLLETMTAQVENLAHAVALEAADKILINDLVSLQKMLDHQIRSHATISYLFILKNDEILGHTFKKGVPAGMMKANALSAGNQPHFQKIASTEGEKHLDMAWPIFDGKAGILRLGFSESHYRRQMTSLWLQMCGLTLVILLMALGGSILFVKRITKPLAALAQATQKIDKGEQNVRVQVLGKDEVGQLAISFNHMVARMEEYTGKLEEQTMELERAHHQTRTFCGIVQEIGALRSLEEIGIFLIKRFQNIFKCVHMVILIFNNNRSHLFALSIKGAKVFNEPALIQNSKIVLQDIEKVTFSKKNLFNPPLVPDDFQKASRQAIVPLHSENQYLGALVIACPGGCGCNLDEIDSAGLILNQAAGVINRAVIQEEEIRDLQSRLEMHSEFSGLIGKDPKMQMIYKLIENVAPTDATVLIQGESGTGKELVARAIHQNSLRKDKPFVVINCSAYPATLLESELFGHEKGAFTGATRNRLGRFEQANRGTVFLDEIGEISTSAQIKFLRVLQTKKFERLGGDQTLTVDVRILAATNKDLLNEVKNSNFREDLYYRLNVIPIQLPPLRDRRNDIPLLALHFLHHFAQEQRKEVDEFRPEVMRLLLDYPWPGNVRELENSIEHAVVLAKAGQITASDLPLVLHNTLLHDETDVIKTLIDQEKISIEEALQECGWNKKLAAKRLGISRNTLYVKLKKYQISRPITH